ncbi:MAG: murein biosynthesis integral membrane protein MurJ [Candidatus Shapirobacteria bacterium]|jgi:putative peptidoglycan lipid II flippase
MTIRERVAIFSIKKQNSILSASLVLGITFAISALLGFLRSRFLYAHFFKCCVLELDVYNAAFRLPDLVFKLLVTGALSASFIPVFSSYLHKDKETADKIGSTVINLLFIVFLFCSISIFIFARPLTRIIASGFSADQLALMVDLTRILLVAQVFFLISNFVTAILQVNQIFIIPALSPITYNIFIILGIFTLAPTFGIYGVVYGVVIGSFFHLAIQIPVLRKIGFNYTRLINIRLKGVKEVFRLMVPRSLSLGLGEIENTVTLFFASSLAAGSISLLNLSLQLMYLPSRIFGTTIGQASLPILSKNIARNEMDIFRQTVKKTLLQSVFIALPITTLILIQRVSIVRIAFGSREFPWTATLLTARILAFLTPAIVCQAVSQILIRSFYAMHNTKIPLYVSFFSLVLNISSSYYLINFTSLGVIGLAISASLSNIVQFVGLFWLFIKKVDGFYWDDVFKRFGKMVFASLLTGLISWGLVKLLDVFVLDTSKTTNLVMLFSVSTFFGIFVYFVISHWLMVQECRDFEKYFIKLKQLVLK